MGACEHGKQPDPSCLNNGVDWRVPEMMSLKAPASCLERTGCKYAEKDELEKRDVLWILKALGYTFHYLSSKRHSLKLLP